MGESIGGTGQENKGQTFSWVAGVACRGFFEQFL
jgi:hypothetical protein